MRRPLQIAIDGPVGSGKSDISARLAKDLGLIYLYTGAMYRALAWACTQEGIPFKNEARVMAIIPKYVIELKPPDEFDTRGFSVWVNNINVTDKLFTPDMSTAASDVSTLAAVRKYMVQRQQDMAKGKAVVMEGRDIGLRVLPDAQLKIYLTATLEERAKRRWQQHNEKQDFTQVLEETRARDSQDMTRAADPLMKLPDAWELDTTGMTQEQVVDVIKKELLRRNLI